MKKLFSLIFILILGLSLTGCVLEKEKTTPQDEASQSPQDDSSEIIEEVEKINDSELEEFEAELDKLEEEINQP